MMLCLSTDTDREPIVQKKAEQIYLESGGRYGTPPGIPLKGYDQMCVDKGNKDVSAATRHAKESPHGIRKTTHIRKRNVHLRTDKIQG